MALGLAIVFGLMGVINMAHGELMALGAYATFVVQGWFQFHMPASLDYYFLVALPVSFLVAGTAGFPLHRRLLRFLVRPPLQLLLPPRRGGWMPAPSPSAPGWPAWPAARSRRSATWARSWGRITSSTRSWWW